MATPVVNWSVWKKTPQVHWRWDGKDVSVIFAMAPLAVVPLPSHRLVAIAADREEHGSANLLLFDFDGVLRSTLTAPELGEHSHFGGAQESGGDGTVQATIGFYKDGSWLELCGALDMQTGTLNNLHRAY